jgi:streptogramin lyase
VDFVNDSVVLVGNPGLNSVSPVNVRTGVATDPIGVGVFPQSIRTVGDLVLVANANLVNFVPAAPGAITVLDAETLTLSGTIPLSGWNPGVMQDRSDGQVYVLNSGNFGGADGSLSIVDPRALLETAHHPGFGEFPGGLAVGTGGDVYVSSFSYGIAIFDPVAGSFEQSPAEALAPNGTPSSSGLGFDEEGRLYALEPQCQQPASTYRLTSEFQVEAVVSVGTCPIAIAFTSVKTEVP